MHYCEFSPMEISYNGEGNCTSFGCRSCPWENKHTGGKACPKHPNATAYDPALSKEKEETKSSVNSNMAI